MLCKDCEQETFPSFGSHHCIQHREDGSHTVMWKTWDDSLNAWRVDKRVDSGPSPKDGPNTMSYFDIKQAQWVTLTFGPKEETEGYYTASCELPPRVVPRDQPTQTHNYNLGPVRPWEGVDRNRFPETWKMLVFLYFQNDWWRGRYIRDDIYKQRLAGEYVKEVPTQTQGTYTERYQYGNED